jgi:hypothetical protein
VLGSLHVLKSAYRPSALLSRHNISITAAKPNDAMDPEVRVNAINKEVRRLFNRGAFSLVHVDAVPSHANIIGTRIIYMTKALWHNRRRGKSSLDNTGMPRRQEESDCFQCSDCISCIHPHPNQLRCKQRLSCMD